MEKQSVDLLNLALLSLLTGAGTYAGGRGIHDLVNKNTPKEEDPSTLNITLPEARMPKHASAAEVAAQVKACEKHMAKFPNFDRDFHARYGKEFDETNMSLRSAEKTLYPKHANSGVEDYIMPALTGALGIGGGFFGASSLYENYKKKQLKNQLTDVEQQYLNALQQAHQKTAEAKTPHVDNFIVGMFAKIGEALEKHPEVVSLLKQDSLSKQAWESPDFMGSEGFTDSIVHQAQNAKDSFFNTELGKATAAAMLLTGMGGAGLTFSTARHLDNKDDDLKRKTTIPTDIRLHVSK